MLCLAKQQCIRRVLGRKPWPFGVGSEEITRWSGTTRLADVNAVRRQGGWLNIRVVLTCSSQGTESLEKEDGPDNISTNEAKTGSYENRTGHRG